MSVIVELNGVTYTDENLASMPKVYAANDLIGNELQADSLTVDIIAGSGGSGRLLTAYGEPVKDKDGKQVYVAGATQREPVGIPVVQYGDVVTIWNGGHNRIIAKMYAESVERVAKEVYRITATSAVGLLIRRKHYGGIYTGMTASDLLAELFGAIPYSVGENVGGVQVYGHLPIATARDNLHILLQSLGASVLKDASGDVLIDFIDPETAVSVPISQTAMGGSVSQNVHATKVIVVEHSFLQTNLDEQEVLFDNTGEASVTDKVVTFNEPCYDLQAVGLTVSESGANYAIVSGVGTLTGTKYTHTMEEREEATGATGEENVVAVRENELINTLNSAALAERLVNYYGASNTATVEVAGSDYYAGHHVLFTNAYGEASEGYVEEADISLSVMLDKTALRLATDYMPGPFGSDYDSFLIIDEAGEWSVPAELAGKKVKVYTFGGARGGQAGFNGANGDLFFGSVGKSGAGGAGGEGGQGFKAYAEELTLDSASYTVSIGAGGAGGASNGALGVLGGDTTFGSISSASGAEIVQFLNILSGGVYGIKGDNGVAGNAGGVIGESWKFIETWHDGLNTASISWPIPYAYGEPGTVYGGCGGGAAMGANGGNAWSIQPPNAVYEHGGDGATATIVPLQADGYGYGGDGGHGGGGGGASGGYKFNSGGSASGGAGNGGAGSAGGQGADGFVLIFYHS